MWKSACHPSRLSAAWMCIQGFAHRALPKDGERRSCGGVRHGPFQTMLELSHAYTCVVGHTMKFMRLGSKPDTFQKHGDAVRVATDLSSDVILCVEDVKFELHKFPLLSKCGRLQRLVAEACNKRCKELKIQTIPGGAESFEICAKFCYGIAITLNAFNVMSALCAAEYLEMTEVIERGNFISKLEVFLNSSILQSWKDSIIALQSTKYLLPWSSDLKLVSRCIESIASKASVNASKVDWSFTYMRAGLSNSQFGTDNVSPPWNGIQSSKLSSTPKDWWMEDISGLEIDVYSRIIATMKSKGRVSQDLIGEALRIYACRWLPGISKDQNLIETVRGEFGNQPHDYIETRTKHKMLLETIVSLLPAEKGSCSCRFLLKLLKAATILDAASSSRMELALRVGLQLEEASLNDLLIPSLSYTSDSLYDVDLLQYILEQFMVQDQCPGREPQPPEAQAAENLNFLKGQNHTSSHSPKLRVAKLIDGYLAEIARDARLSVAKFTAIAEAIPDSARLIHDGLYKAIDIFLKEHPELTKVERKRVCRIMDCRKLSMDACMHAAQNERLPLRVVVQVLFFEQVRTAMTGGFLLNDVPTSVKALMVSQEEGLHAGAQPDRQDDEWQAVHHELNLLKGDLARMKGRLAEAEREKASLQQEVMKQSKARGLFSFPSKPMDMLSKIGVSRAKSGAKPSQNLITQQSADQPDLKQTASRRRHSLS